MKCPKCPGTLKTGVTKHGAAYYWCLYCKGLVISAEDLQKIVGHDKASFTFLNPGLGKKAVTKFRCSRCDKLLSVGTVLNSQYEIEQCESCHLYYLSADEINEVLALAERSQEQVAKIQVPAHSHRVHKLEERCPVCLDQPLWAFEGQEHVFKGCMKCEGLMTNVEALQGLTKKSLFSPSMFTFRSEHGQIALCRHCGEEQSASNNDCQKCGRELRRVECTPCQGRMGEYVLKSIVIDRCQMCNSVWLDQGEFEKIMTAMPDVRKQYENERRQSELFAATAAAVTYAVELGFDITQRKMLDRFWGRFSVLFYPK